MRGRGSAKSARVLRLFWSIEGRAHHQNLAVRELFSKEPPQKSWEIKLAKLTVSAKVIANFFGIAERTIRSWVQKGMPRVADGVYNPNDCFEWWNEFFNTGSRKKGSSDGDDPESFEDVKERFWAVKAGNEELKNIEENTKNVLKLRAEDDLNTCFIALNPLPDKVDFTKEDFTKEDINLFLDLDQQRLLASIWMGRKVLSPSINPIHNDLEASKKGNE